MTTETEALWFALKGDRRLGRCATEDCGGQPAWRLESGGVGSDYCSGCKQKIGGIEVISRHSNQIGDVKVNFTVGRIR